MEKTYVFDGAHDSNSAMLAAMNGGMGGAWNNPIWALAFLGIFANGGFFGGGRRGDTDFVASQLGQAIAGNANALNNLSTHLDCTVGQIQSGINALQTAIGNVANQVGMSGMQVINAVNSGDAGIISTLQSCCCDVKNLVTTQGYENRLNNMQQSQLIQGGFSEIGYKSAEQTCAIKQAIADQTLSVIGKIDAQESARKDREIATLTAQLATVNARAERAAELAPIYKTLEEIKSKQPNTVPVPWPQLTAIPTRDLLYGGYGAYGIPGQWS